MAFALGLASWRRLSPEVTPTHHLHRGRDLVNQAGAELGPTSTLVHWKCNDLCQASDITSPLCYHPEVLTRQVSACGMSLDTKESA